MLQLVSNLAESAGLHDGTAPPINLLRQIFSSFKHHSDSTSSNGLKQEWNLILIKLFENFSQILSLSSFNFSFVNLFINLRKELEDNFNNVQTFFHHEKS